MRKSCLAVSVTSQFERHQMPLQRFTFYAIVLLSFLCCSCSSSDESPSEVGTTPPEGDDFFPAMAIGDSVEWHFINYFASGGSISPYFEGVLTWHVAARVNNQAGATTTIQQTFRGFKSTPKSPTLRDTVWLAPEQTTITVKESSDHHITLSNNVWGASGAGYGGGDITFPRYTVGAKDTLVFQGGITFSTVTIQLKKTVGLIDYVWDSGAGMGGYHTKFHRR
jgi:hypothetical protein